MCKCPIVLKFFMSIGFSDCMKTVKYLNSMSAFACARKYLRSRPCYNIGKWSKLENDRILMRFLHLNVSENKIQK
jgi:hypothetical protein